MVGGFFPLATTLVDEVGVEAAANAVEGRKAGRDALLHAHQVEAVAGGDRALPFTRRELESLVSRIEHVSLETHPNFFDYFVEGCQFVPVGSEVLDS